MGVDWELVRSGPDGAEHGVLLLPGGANAARSYSEVMAQPMLAGTRLVAATLPGNVGPRHPPSCGLFDRELRAARLRARCRPRLRRRRGFQHGSERCA